MGGTIVHRVAPSLAIWGFAMVMAGAATAGVVPKQADICIEAQVPIGGAARAATGLVVDPEKLIAFTLDANNVRRAVENGVKGADAPGGRPGRQLLFIIDKPCATDAAKCGKSDVDAVQGARGDLIGFLTNANLALNGDIKQPAYRAQALISGPEAFFDGAQIECVPGHETAGVTAPPPAAPPIYVRGGADALYIQPGSGAFSGASKANITFTGDGGTHKETAKIVAVLGYPIDLGADPNVRILVPYAGINRNFSHTKGAAKVVTADTWNLGISYAFTLKGLGSGADSSATDWFVVRPDFLFDDHDASRLGSLNLLYAPYLRRWGLNGTYPILGSKGDAIAYVQTISEIHLDGGWYSDRGSKPGGHEDYMRLGPKVGFALINADPNLPLTLTLTNLHMWGGLGKPRDIDYSTAALSWGLDAKRNASVDLTYSNGRREDTASREQLWGVAIAAKY